LLAKDCKSFAAEGSLILATDSLLSNSARPFSERIIQHENTGIQFEEWLFRAKIELLKNNIHLTPERLKNAEKKLIDEKLRIFRNTTQ